MPSINIMQTIVRKNTNEGLY